MIRITGPAVGAAVECGEEDTAGLARPSASIGEAAGGDANVDPRFALPRTTHL